MTEPVDRHRRACAGFSRVADALQPDQWPQPTPCTERDAQALVEHVIGFHEFLLLRSSPRTMLSALTTDTSH